MRSDDINEMLHALRMQARGATYGNDCGDEHRDPPPKPPPALGSIEALLAEWDDPPKCSYECMEFIMLAQAYRDCCHHCALEVNGEDGS